MYLVPILLLQAVNSQVQVEDLPLQLEQHLPLLLKRTQEMRTSLD